MLDITSHLSPFARDLAPTSIAPIIKAALAEDLGPADLTTQALVAEGAKAGARILAREPGVIAGLAVAEMVFRSLDPALEWNPRVEDGRQLQPGQEVVALAGKARALLSGERTALNFLQRMSGIATQTARFVAAVAGTKARILDTRKTAPGLRLLDKYAVRAGGGYNHRFGLFDGVLIKDNHLKLAGGVGQAVALARANLPHPCRVEVEAETLDQVEEALAAGAEAILLDNMTISMLAQAVALVGGRALLEASGRINLENVREAAETGVDFISIGALTHSVKALDLAMEME